MNRVAISLILATCLSVACRKTQDNAPSSKPLSIAGQWKVDSVTNFFYDAGGTLVGTEIAYPLPPPGQNYPLYFQFNDDHSWSESLVVPLDTTVVSQGTYSYASDSTFNLRYPDASPARQDELCNIVSLSNTSFVFSQRVHKNFNGTDPGFIKYVFRLGK